MINTVSLQQLGTFLEATNWRLIWGLNLGSGYERQAVAEAEAVRNAAGDKLLAFQIGSEPDLPSEVLLCRGFAGQSQTCEQVVWKL